MAVNWEFTRGAAQNASLEHNHYLIRQSDIAADNTGAQQNKRVGEEKNKKKLKII